MGLILGCNLASAKSVSCWDEYVTEWKSEPTSKMAQALGNDVTIIRVDGGYKFHFFDGNGGVSTIKSHTVSPIMSTYNNYTYVLTQYAPFYYSNNTLAANISYSTFSYLYGNYSMAYFKSGIDIFHTYCIVDEGSSGGGGGGATGSVNFIIKATS